MCDTQCGTKCKYIKVKPFANDSVHFKHEQIPRIPYPTSINFPATKAAMKSKMRKGIIALIKQKQYYQPTMLQKELIQIPIQRSMADPFNQT